MFTKGDEYYRNLMSTKLGTIVIILIGSMVAARLPANDWHAYLSCYQTVAIAKGDQQIFAANENGLFSYHLSDNRFETRSRVEGLSDSGISAISWSTTKGALIIGYSNGNLDLLSGNRIINLPDIKLKGSIYNKSINNILCEGDFAWLSCNFGIVKINLKKWEVAETWIIGPDASPVAVRELTADQRYFWAATGSGVFRAEKNIPNLQDYKNWIRQEQLPFPQNQFTSISMFNGHVYVCDITGKIFSFDGVSWQPAYPDINGIKKIAGSQSSLLLISDNSIEMIEANSRTQISTYGTLLPTTSKINPTDALIDDSGDLWIGDRLFGLIRRTASGSFYPVVPSSPATNNCRWLTTAGADLYVATASSALESDSTPAEINRLKDQNWISVSEYSDSKLSGLKNITRVAPAPSDPEHYWGSTKTDGLLEFNGQKTTRQYNSTNSPLESFNGTCKIGGVIYDVKGNLWITNPRVKNQLHVVKPDGTWQSMSYPGIDNQFASAGDILVSRTDTKWIIVNQSELFALRTHNTLDNTGDDEYRKTRVQSRFSNGENTVIKGFNQINALTEDHDGYLWVGTENGIVRYTDPEMLFKNTAFYGEQPSVELGDGLYHPLLENEIIHSIAVDGANRKWFGTSSSGAFLFSSDGSKLVRHFTTDNSPLLSNQVVSIAINSISGEVFFATDRGLISWKGDATEGNNSFQHLYVWPNPVRETWDGDVTIDGLQEDSSVKITDIAGNLVYKTTSNGGRAVWDGKNRSGQRVSTGVYLIFCSNFDGNQSRVIKLLFIH